MDHSIRRRANNPDMEYLGRIQGGTTKSIWRYRRQGRSKNQTQKHETRQKIGHGIQERVSPSGKRSRTGRLDRGRTTTRRNEHRATERLGSQQRRISKHGGPCPMGNTKRNQTGNGQTPSGEHLDKSPKPQGERYSAKSRRDLPPYNEQQHPLRGSN